MKDQIAAHQKPPGGSTHSTESWATDPLAHSDSPARFERVGGRALILTDLDLLHLYGNVLQLEVKFAQEVVSCLWETERWHW